MTLAFDLTPGTHESRVLVAFCRSWWDGLDDPTSPTSLHLLSYAPLLVNTYDTPEQEERRAWLVLDWYIRKYIPFILEAAGLTDHAQALRQLPEQNSPAALADSQTIRDAARSAAEAAWSIFRDIAGDIGSDIITRIISKTAGYTVWHATNAAGYAVESTWYAATENTAGYAIRTAIDADGYTVLDAAMVAAWTAAWTASGAVVKDVTKSMAWRTAWIAAGATTTLEVYIHDLQESAFDLLDHMIAMSKPVTA